MLTLRETSHLVALACGLLGVAAQAAETPPQFGRYLPLYPGLYFDGGYAKDDRDASYDRNGSEVETAVPTIGGKTRFPESRYDAAFTWHFPMFESYHLPFFSSRTHLARVNLRHVETKTEGALADFAADPSDDSSTEADKLENNGSGIGDLTLEFGSFLYGSDHWRERSRTELSVLGLIGLRLPFGVYNHDAPINSGSNSPAFHLQLGLHWEPWSGGFLDAGFTHREYFQNYDPQFGALAPAEQGDDRVFDLSLAQRVFKGLYLSAFASRREGDPNLYENPRFAPNAPDPPDGSSTAPTPGTYRDGGTLLTSYGLSLQYFVTQTWLVALHYQQPHSGKSGQFLLPFTNHTPAGCVEGASNCQTEPGETILVDGLGPARSYASDSLMLTVTHNFGLGDTFTCTGCKQ